jgi:VIT1/CCC1 family predicted Fe2+/Mn2+ transporter
MRKRYAKGLAFFIGAIVIVLTVVFAIIQQGY